MAGSRKCAGLLVLLAPTFVGCASSNSPKATTTSTSVPATAPGESPDADWSTGGHDLGSRRWNAATQAPDARHVKRLRVAWRVDRLVGVSGTPAVVDGVVYVGGWDGHVRALDASTGKQRWSSDLRDSIAGSPTVT